MSIEAEKMEIFQVGTGAEINSAIFDVGYEYVGEQKCPYYAERKTQDGDWIIRKR